MWNKVKIAISGKSGCGNTTVSRLLAKRLNLRLINYTFRDMAREKNIPFEEFCEMVEDDHACDLELDSKLLKLAQTPGCVLGSRLAIWLLKDADLKVYLTATPRARAARIAQREKEDIEQAFAKMTLRDKRDRQRYIALYDVDNDNYFFADLIVEAEKYSAAQIVDKIVSKLEEKKRG